MLSMFDYKVVDNKVSFGKNALDNIIKCFYKRDISFVIVDFNKIILNNIIENNNNIIYRKIGEGIYQKLIVRGNINKCLDKLNIKELEKINEYINISFMEKKYEV